MSGEASALFDFEKWKKSDEYVGLVWTGANGAGMNEVARAAWNAAIRAAVAEMEYIGAGEDEDGDRVRAVRGLIVP